MLRKLYDAGLQEVDWILMKEWYSDMTSQVQLGGELSRPFQEQQGVRQGGIWSPKAYMAFINPILKTFEENAIGYRIGSIHVATPTCADDELLLSNDKYELSTLTEVQASYANQERCMLSDQKIIVFNQKKEEKEGCMDLCTLNGKVIETVDTYTHIGVIRHSKSSTNLSLAVDEAIQTARKTTYSLMGRISRDKWNQANNQFAIMGDIRETKTSLCTGMPDVEKAGLPETCPVSKEGTQSHHASPRKSSKLWNLYTVRATPHRSRY